MPAEFDLVLSYIIQTILNFLRLLLMIVKKCDRSSSGWIIFVIKVSSN